jgi:thiol:disulfide interchange protein DsbD
MGLLELAAAMKFLSNVDLVWGWGIFTRNTVLLVWVVIGAILTLYLFGLLKLGHAPRLKRPGPSRTVVAIGAVALSVWLGTGLSGRGLGELEAFLPPASLSGASANGEMSWIVNDYEAALKEAQRQNRPIFVDFTGYTCTNCRWMESNMFPKPDVARELSRYVRVRLYTDGKGEMFERFQQMQQDRFGTVALPYYAVLKPDGQPVVTFGGLTRNPDDFIRFLRKGLE